MSYHHIKAPSQRELSPKVTGSYKKFLHQRLFHQFQLFKALLYGLLLLVYALYKGGKIILKFFKIIFFLQSFSSQAANMKYK